MNNGMKSWRLLRSFKSTDQTLDYYCSINDIDCDLAVTHGNFNTVTPPKKSKLLNLADKIFNVPTFI